MTEDHFGTAALRSAVLNAWIQSPTRLREDANTEEDHAAGYYRDRVIVELAQNAADAAARAGVEGRLLLEVRSRWDGHVLVASNTGARLDAAGVESLASLRASAKSPSASGLIGRFGVGFAAMRSVADEIAVVSGSHGVQFSLRRTVEAVSEAASDRPDLEALVTERGHSLPVLRLPYPADASAREYAVDGYDTTVVLWLRDAAAVSVVEAQLAALDDTLLLAMTALGQVEVRGTRNDRVLRDVESRWITAHRAGEIPADLLAARPVEERARSSWSVTWAVGSGLVTGAATGAAIGAATSTSVDGATGAGSVVRAPTPTDEPLSIPAVLIATVPLDPSRRHVAAGPLTDWLVQRAGEVYADLAARVGQPLDLVPIGLARGRLDAQLREAVTAALRAEPLFDGRRAADVVMVDGDVSADFTAALEPTGLGVIDVAPRNRAAARLLGFGVLSIADVVDALPAGLTPAQWRDVYAALEPVMGGDRTIREALAALFVPLADGAVTRGPEGLVLAPAILAESGTALASAAVTPAGVRMVHPEAAHPLLLRLGALAASDPAVLRLPAVEAAVRELSDELVDTENGVGPSWPDGVVGLFTLLGNVLEEHRLEPHELPSWWSAFPLPGDDGLWHEARDLASPGSWADENLDLPLLDVPVRWAPLGPSTARALGVRSSLVTERIDYTTGDGTGPDVAGWAEYDDYLCAVLGADRAVGELTVIADLDIVRDDSWASAIEAILSAHDLREALLTDVAEQAHRSGGRAVSYTAWFLRDVLGAPFAAPSGVPAGASSAAPPGARAVDADFSNAVGQTLPPVPDELRGVDDARALRALGALASVEDVREYLSTPAPTAWDSFFTAVEDRLTTGERDGAVGVAVPLALARAVWAAAEVAALAGLEMDPIPEIMVALSGTAARIVAARDLAVTGEPMWAQIRAVVPVASPDAVAAVAHALDCEVLDSATALVRSDDADDPTTRQMPAAVHALVPQLPTEWTEYTELDVDGHEVDWWVSGDGRALVRAAAGVAAAAAACAQVAGRWTDRHLVELALSAPERSAEITALEAWSGPTENPPGPRGA